TLLSRYKGVLHPFSPSTAYDRFEGGLARLLPDLDPFECEALCRRQAQRSSSGRRMKLWAMRLASSFVMRFMTAHRPGCSRNRMIGPLDAAGGEGATTARGALRTLTVTAARRKSWIFSS